MADPASTKEKVRGNDFSLVDSFKWGYRNREDVTNLPPGVLIKGSKNVLTNISDRVQIRQGYQLDGAVSSVAAPVANSFDWLTRGNGSRNVRVGGLTSAGNDGKLQYRYVDSADAISWRDLATGLTTVAYNFTTFWNTTESLREMLYVNGTSNIFKWNGATAEVLSATATTITKTGTTTWLDAGFYAQSLTTIGSSTSQFDITNPAGTTFRYTWDGTGTDPAITATSVPVGSKVLIGAQNFTAGNNGLFTVTGSGTNYFEVTNASGVVESNKTIGTGYIYTNFTKIIVIGGVSYAYTGGENTTTLTGVVPSAAAVTAGEIVHQAPVTVPNSTMMGIPSTFTNGLIKVLNNQLFVASLTSPTVYISKVNVFTDFSQSTPRQAGEGATLILDANIVAFEPQEKNMYVSAGDDRWYEVSFELQTSTVGVTYEQVNALPLKTGKQQGAQSQAFVSHMKNDIIVLTNEPTVDKFGRVAESLQTPQMTNISDSIKIDMDQYDFTDGSIFYFQYYIYVAIPMEGIVIVYNLATQSWEAPQELPISRFYIVNGELYGHSYNTFESYKLFSGYADRIYTGFDGFPIQAVWKFSYQNYGNRAGNKSATKLYTEGYINQNTTLEAEITYEIDGCATVKTFDIVGDDAQIVCLPSVLGSLGKESIGKSKLGGSGNMSINGLPPKFRSIKTFSNTDFFEVSISYSVLGTDNRAEILAFGLAAYPSSQGPVSITQ